MTSLNTVKEKTNPFPGLRSFNYTENGLFFGRDWETEEITGRLLQEKFIAIIGNSGSGKTSLINCGLLPKLRSLSSLGQSRWESVTLRPGIDPVGNLAGAVFNFIDGRRKGTTDEKSVIDRLKNNNEGLADICKEFIGEDEKLLIVVDQLEDIFRYRQLMNIENAGKDLSRFISLLAEAVSLSSGFISLVTAIRSDFMKDLSGFPELNRMITTGNFMLFPPGKEVLPDVIGKPVMLSGASINNDLTGRIMNDIEEHGFNLSVLQHTLSGTWKCWKELDDPERPVSISDYETAGTLNGAVSRSAGKIYGELNPDDKKVCEALFKSITGRNIDGRLGCNPLDIKTIKEWTGCSDKHLNNLIKKFSSPDFQVISLLPGTSGDGNIVIDLREESLISSWDLLGKWVEEEASSAGMYLRLSEESALYQQGKTGLLKQPVLQQAIEWKERYNPGLNWAKRYDPAWERVMVYLRVSQKSYLKEEEAKTMLRRKKIRRAGILSGILGFILVILTISMVYSFIRRGRLGNDLKEADREKTYAISQKNFAEEFAAKAIKRSIEADSIAMVAAVNEKEVQKLLEITENHRKEAEKNAKSALKQKTLALIRSDSAIKAGLEAGDAVKSAIEEKTRAQALRMISLAKAMTIRSLQLNGQIGLQTLLAYQAYLFNKRYNGQRNDADILSGLYNIAKQNGDVNIKTFTGHNGEIKSIAFVPGKGEFFTSGADGKVLKWDLDNKHNSLEMIYSGTDIMEVLAVSPDAGWLACGGQSAAIRMIPVNGKGIGFELRGHKGKIESLVFSFDSRFLYSAAVDGNVLKWDIASKSSVIVSPAAIMIARMDLSADNRRIAGVGAAGNAFVWDPERINDVFTIESPGRQIKTVRFKPGENILAVGYTDGYLEIWDVDKKEKLSGVKAHNSEINDIRFNSVLSQMATAGNDGKLNLWDTDDLNSLPAGFSDNDGIVMTVGFSPDGQIIISGTMEGKANLVARPTNSDLLAQNICSKVERNFTPEEWAAYIGKDIEYEKTCPAADLKIRIREINRK